MSKYPPELNTFAITFSVVALVVSMPPYLGKSWGAALIPIGMSLVALMSAIKIKIQRSGYGQ